MLVAEDIDFFSHHGFAVEELKKAVQEAWEEGEMPRGASTLTQQLAKNLWLSPSRNPLRKLKEALLTRSLEKHLEKRRILELYLNVVEFAPGVYGAEAAAQRFFGKPAAELSRHEAAALAGGLPKPSSWHPGASEQGLPAARRTHRWPHRTRRLAARRDLSSRLDSRRARCWNPRLMTRPSSACAGVTASSCWRSSAHHHAH